jgi:hypothetical protein
MNETQFEALRAAAQTGDGVSMAGFEAGHDPEADAYWVVTPDTERSGLSEAAFREVATTHDEYVTNWYFWTETAPDSEAREAYLRWLEGADEQGVPERYDTLADGITRSWGQLRLTVTLGDDGYRVYEIRHEDDVDADGADLESYNDPLDARQLAKHDDRGRYRPLKTAPSLRTGWVFTDLDATEVVDAVEFIYPATIANWHREREGELDVTHWEEHVERQSGIYGIVKTWNRQDGHEHVEWVADACCADSECIKRREWDYDEDSELDVPRGDGAFPCREPCSLVLAAARQWTKLEGEQSQTYEFELTPSEKEQLERIVGAVADGETEDIREADVYDGANRYRTRFLRAKLFDEDDNLCGVETERDSESDGGGH